MPRFFVGTDQISDKDIVITGTDVNHIRNVLRMTPGEEVTVSDGQGMDYFCRIAELTKEEVRLDIVDSWHSFVELPAKIYLFQGLPKADKMELIIQKAVELGVYEIVPVATKRAVVKLDPKKEEKKRLRWQSIAESAAKQAGRALIPQIATCITFEKALRMCNGLDAALIPYEKAEGMQHAVIRYVPSMANIQSEYSLDLKADLKRVRLRRPERPVLYRLPLDTEFCGQKRPD